MKKTKAMQLVKALRSNNYAQGVGQLVDTADRFCILGVACNISKAELDWVETGIWGWAIGGEEMVLPQEIQDEFGIYSRNGARRDGLPIRINGEKHKTLADANDNGCSFTQLARYIKKNYKQL